MLFTTKRYSFDTFDGKIILLACLDHPVEYDDIKSQYLSAYSERCNDFVRNRLIENLRDRYFIARQERFTFERYRYELKITEFYDNGVCSSYLLTAKLYESNKLMFNQIDTAVFYNEYCVPERLLTKRKRKGRILLNENGIPCIVELIGDELVVTKLSNKAFHI